MTVNREIAEQDIDRWLNFRRVSASKRETNKASIEALIDEVAEGNLILNDDNTFTYKLLDKPEGDNPDVLKFKSRLLVNDVHSEMKGVKMDDPNGMIKAYCAALTGMPKAYFGKLTTDDYGVCQTIALFFIK